MIREVVAVLMSDGRKCAGECSYMYVWIGMMIVFICEVCPAVIYASRPRIQEANMALWESCAVEGQVRPVCSADLPNVTP